MAIEAKLADGRVLRFPDGTNPDVIDSTVQNLLAESRPALAPKPAPSTPVVAKEPEPPKGFKDLILKSFKRAFGIVKNGHFHAKSLS